LADLVVERSASSSGRSNDSGSAKSASPLTVGQNNPIGGFADSDDPGGAGWHPLDGDADESAASTASVAVLVQARTLRR